MQLYISKDQIFIFLLSDLIGVGLMSVLPFLTFFVPKHSCVHVTGNLRHKPWQPWPIIVFLSLFLCICVFVYFVCMWPSFYIQCDSLDLNEKGESFLKQLNWYSELSQIWILQFCLGQQWTKSSDVQFSEMVTQEQGPCVYPCWLSNETREFTFKIKHTHGITHT